MTSPSTTAADVPDAGTMLLIDKPSGWTSFDVVRKVRNLTHANKVGHAGTLDPTATGLLVLCTGKKTKSLDQYMGLEKEYTGSLKLGERTSSFDTETDVVERGDWSSVSEDAVRVAARSLTGMLAQIPPMYSAVKYGGKALYKYARKGKTVEREPRTVEVREFSITHIRLPLVEFRVVCSKGTYIRSLVDELGQKLGCGAVLTSLRRVRIGTLLVQDAWTMEECAARLSATGPANLATYEAGIQS